MPAVPRLSHQALGRTLAFASVAETGTGLALLAAPALVAALLLGAELPAIGAVLGRCFGIALLALALACWPGRSGGGAAAQRAMLAYNALVALYLAWLGAAEHFGGLLLWPAVVLHAVVALVLTLPSRGAQ